MIVYVDIDETICISPEDRDYSKALPIEKNIKKMNSTNKDSYVGLFELF